MTKYDITRLADFVRGAAAPETEQEIRDGLASAPARTRKDLELLGRVAEVGRWDREHEVPESAVRIARAIGSLRPPAEGAAARSRRLPFQILFDSFGSLVPAGIRSGEMDARHLVAEAGDFTVDARLEPGRRMSTGLPEGGSLAAQLLRRDGGKPIPNAPVVVWAGDRVVSAGLTNPDGDFQATDLPDGPLSVCFVVEHEACIELPLELPRA